ncbi:response regulator transcription factor [Halarchaeum salinum]|uniref:Response regulatory domain-containing protein n=1 Tax=Halarchaeum salinum TaxID=489912 RepID=A0AAV3S775_9EURY
MALMICEACSTAQSFSILRSDATCHVCGAGEEFLAPVSEAESEAGVDQSDTVLLADDNDELRETFRLWLSATRWDCRAAADGETTMNALDADVDVLVLDRRMPDLSGPEVVERLSETEFDGQVLVVSAYEQDTHLSEADVDGYLTKPIRRQTFVETLERMVRPDEDEPDE